MRKSDKMGDAGANTDIYTCALIKQIKNAAQTK